MSRERITGYLQVAAAQILYGVGVALAKPTMEEVPVMAFNCAAYLSAGLVFLVPSLAIDHFEWRRISRGQALYIAAIGLMACVLVQVFLVAGLARSPASLAGVMLSTLPSVVVLLSAIILRERLGPRELMGAGLSVAGVALLSWAPHDSAPSSRWSWLGLTLVFVGVFWQALWAVLSKRHSLLVPPYTLTATASLVGAAILLPFIIFSGERAAIISVTPSAWLRTAIFGVACDGLWFILWFKGVRKIPVSHGGVLFGLFPVATILTGVVGLKETLSGVQITAMTSVLVSAVLISYQPKAELLVSVPPT